MGRLWMTVDLLWMASAGSGFCVLVCNLAGWSGCFVLFAAMTFAATNAGPALERR
jgi:hypothetical protein